MTKIIFGTILIVLGVSALLGISLFKFIFAFILIAIGIKIVTDNKDHERSDFKSSGSTTNENFVDELNIFSSTNKTVKSEDFKGGKVVMIFSGGRIDLSQVKTNEKTVDIEIIAIFAVAELVIPKDWKVSSQGTAVLGGYDIKTEESSSSGVTLSLRGAAIFGGVKVIN